MTTLKKEAARLFRLFVTRELTQESRPVAPVQFCRGFTRRHDRLLGRVSDEYVIIPGGSNCCNRAPRDRSRCLPAGDGARSLARYSLSPNNLDREGIYGSSERPVASTRLLRTQKAKETVAIAIKKQFW